MDVCLSALDSWLDGSSASLDLISEVGSIKNSEIMEIDFVDKSDNVGDSTVQVIEVSVHQKPVGGHIRHLGIGTGPNHEYYVSSASELHSVQLTLSRVQV